ncbi:hypothetical protein MSG28_009351 [Choristoneura fumiferana]|uniref:Uncharacterized protein n=1 Tax=Choristoneura fumiferana TaxID=7141 RepID=A0ACC0KXT2_CHOFU|nr:hypothetical protein MSG28_009351 [Choristoneura fumiferana]
MRCLYFLVVVMTCLSLAYCVPLANERKPICVPRNGEPVNCHHCFCPRDAHTRRLLDGVFGTLANFGSMSSKTKL